MVKSKVLFFVAFFLAVLSIGEQAYCNDEAQPSEQAQFQKLYDETPLKEGVRFISYSQLMQLKNSGEKFILLDVLDTDSYAAGHIEGAINFPLSTINKKTASAKLPAGSNLVVYCASFECAASTAAAKRLSKLGYKAFDYKGGLKDWKDNGNQLVK